MYLFSAIWIKHFIIQILRLQIGGYKYCTAFNVLYMPSGDHVISVSMGQKKKEGCVCVLSCPYLFSVLNYALS